jgi:4-hydroxybenzoate polyprenyltransferase
MVAHALFLATMLVVGRWLQLGVLYYAGLAAAAGLNGYQYRLIRERDRERCFKAFVSNGWVGLAIFAGLALDLYFRWRIF